MKIFKKLSVSAESISKRKPSNLNKKSNHLLDLEIDTKIFFITLIFFEVVIKNNSY